MRKVITIFVIICLGVFLSIIAMFKFHQYQMDVLVTENGYDVSESNFIEFLSNSKHVVYKKLSGSESKYKGQQLWSEASDAVYNIESAFVGSRFKCKVSIKNGITNNYFCIYNDD